MATYRPSFWPLRDPTGPTSGYVKVTDTGALTLSFPAPGDPGYVFEVKVTRRDARLWARRINQALEADRQPDPT